MNTQLAASTARAIPLLIVILGVCFQSAIPVAQDGSDTAQAKRRLTWTDPTQAYAEDPDFSIQGEYLSEDSDPAWGAQVVAMGGGQFDVYLLEGGLPGKGWDKSKARLALSGTRADNGVALRPKDDSPPYRGRITRRGFLVISKERERVARLRRIERQSPTLGAQPPKGAIVLFDGRSADEWINGRIDDGLLANNDVTTKKHFGSYRLHLEFRTPYKPYARGQGRGNSGVYHQGRFETQVLDSFGLEGRMNETGGIYGIAHPSINMCFPPLAWQTYDVDFTAARFNEAGEKTTNARMTVRLNGVVVQDDIELGKTTAAARVSDISSAKGPIYLQHHGNPVYYRNIWLVETD